MVSMMRLVDTHTTPFVMDASNISVVWSKYCSGRGGHELEVITVPSRTMCYCILARGEVDDAIG